MAKGERGVLEELHGALTKALVDKINSGEATASDLNVARQFLKDNSIDAIPTESNGLDKLKGILPFEKVESDE